MMARPLCLPLVAAVACCLTASRVHAAEDEAPDPMQVRRVVLPPERVAAELERVRNGALIALPRDEFEHRLLRAREAARMGQDPPRLIDASYSATVVNDALEGTARWRVVNPAAASAILPLQPFNLALRKARVRKGEQDSAEALLGDLDGRGLAWRLERPGENLALLDWSARGVPAPGGIRFDLRIPASPVASLDLTVPADQSPEASVGLLSGPFATERPDRRRWRLDCAGQTQIEVVIRRAERLEQPPLLLASLETRQEIEPDVLRADFDFSLDALQRSARDLTFECDPGLRPFEVTGRHVDGWEQETPVATGQPSKLTVRLRESAREGTLGVRIRTVAPASMPSRWISPTIRLAGAVSRGERLTLRIHPALQLTAWQPGSFEFLSGPGAPGRSRDAWQVVQLVAGGHQDARPERPSALVVPLRPEYRCRVLSWWNIGPRSSSVTAELGFEVLQGEVFQFSCRLPVGWDIERAETTPANMIRTWDTAEKGGRSLLTVDLQHALSPATTSAHLILKLVPRQQMTIGRPVVKLPFPRVEPLGPQKTVGGLGITVDPQLEAKARTDALGLQPEDRGPWGVQALDFYYPVQGLAATDFLEVRQISEDVSARLSAEIHPPVAENRAPSRGEPAVEEAALTATLLGERLRFRYRAEIRNWAGDTMTLQLPPGATCGAVRVGEHWPGALRMTQLDDGRLAIALPLPADQARQDIEIQYEQTVPPWWVLTQLVAEAPTLSLPAPPPAYRWHLPPGVLPVVQESWQRSTNRGTDDAMLGTAWERISAGPTPSKMYLMRREAVTGLALAAAALCVLLYGGLRLGDLRTRVLTLLPGLALGGVGSLWLPRTLQPLGWYPLLACLALVSFAQLRRVVPRLVAAPSLLKTAVPGVLGLLLTLPSRGDAPAPFTVYLLIPKEGAEDARPSVLAPPDLLEQLDDLVRRGSAAEATPVLLSGNYIGEVIDNKAMVRADYRAHAFSAGNANLFLPLGGLQLQSARCNGSDVPTVAVRAPREGYSIALPGPGTHDLVLQFSALTQNLGDEQELRLSIPELPQCHLRLKLPAGAQWPYPAGARGRVFVSPHASALPAKALELTADLGAVPALLVRWRHGAPNRPPTKLQVREAYLWDVRPGVADLRAILQYSGARGAPASLALRLPEGLEVRRLEAGRLPGSAAEEATPRLRHWRLSGAGAQRTLHVDLLRPAAAGVQLNVELIPSRPFGQHPELFVPRPLEAESTQSFLAYRTEGVGTTVREHRGLRADINAGFAAFWQAAGQPEVGPGVHAYAFNSASGAPLLRLELAHSAPASEGLQVDNWKVGAQRTAVTALALVTSPSRNLSLVECDIPSALMGLDVTGPDVRSWSVVDRRLQVWLVRPTERAEVRISGWVPMPSGELLKLPAINLRVPGLRHFVNVVSVDGISVIAQRTHNLWQLPDPEAGQSLYAYLVADPNYEMTFLVQRPRLCSSADLLTLVEVREGRTQLTTHFDCVGASGTARFTTVRLARWTGADIALDAPGATIRNLPAPSGSRAWVLTWPPAAPEHLRFTLTGQLAGPSTADLSVPDITLDAGRLQRWVAVAGRELRGQPESGLVLVPDPTAALAAWSSEAERIRRAGMAWAVQSPHWRLGLQLAQAPVAGGARVLSVEETATLRARKWLHAATFLLFQEAAADLPVALPAGASVMSVQLDGKEAQEALRAGRLTLPTDGLPRVRTVRLEWRWDEEPTEIPRLGRPRLGSEEHATLLTVDTPPGLRVESPSGEPPLAAAEIELQRAEAQLELSLLLANYARSRGAGASRAEDQLASAQARFYRHCRRAQGGAADSPPRIHELKTRNRELAQKHGFEATQRAAELRSAGPGEAPSDQRPGETENLAVTEGEEDREPAPGTLLHWLASAEGVRLHVSPLQPAGNRTAIVRTIVWLAFLGIAAAFALAGRLALFFPKWGPEALVLVSGLAWYCLRPSPFLIAFLVCGVAMRCWLVGRGLLAMGPVPAAADRPPPQSSSS